MKTKRLIQSVAAIVFLFISYISKAQLTYFENKSPCDVKIFIEDYAVPSPAGTPCPVCYSGFINLPANSGQVPYTLCANHDICIAVVTVDGVTITWYNHANWGLGCHGSVQSIVGQSGTSGACTWSANFTGSGWEIQ